MIYKNSIYTITKICPKNYLIDVYEPRLYHTHFIGYTSFGIYIKRMNAIEAIRNFIDRDVGLIESMGRWEKMIAEHERLFSGMACDEQIRLDKLGEWLIDRQRSGIVLYKAAPRNITTDDLNWILYSAGWWEYNKQEGASI